MAARKLQAEIDRTLKKVSEGVELFESIYDKMQASTNQTQKEKLETDLKTQIKKLQRLRDQIKSWVASSDIKDKSILLENRKLIETQMEKFKACEKEMKTKAFSKEGLTAALKLDPKAQERSDIIAWLQTMVDELGMQVESAEAEIETLQGGTKKKGKTGGAAERLEGLEHLNERRKWHVSRLELILRLLENGSLQTEKVVSVKEDVTYFVESNTDEDFDEDEGIYDELNLEEQEGRFGLTMDEPQSDDESMDASEDMPPRTPMKDGTRKATNEEDYKKEEVVSPVLKKGVAARKQSTAEASKPSLPPNFAQQPMASVVKASIPQPARPPAMPPMKYSLAAAAGSSVPPASVQVPQSATPLSATIPASASGSSAAHIPQADHAPNGPPSPSLTHPSLSAASPILSTTSASGAPVPSQTSRPTPPPESVGFDSTDASPVISEAAPAATSSPHRPLPHDMSIMSEATQASSPPAMDVAPLSSLHVAPGRPVRQPTAIGTQPVISQPSQHMRTPPPVAPPGISRVQPIEIPAPTLVDNSQGVFEHDEGQRQPIQHPSRVSEAPQQPLPNSLADLLISFDGAKQRAATRMSDLEGVHKLLEAGYPSIPQPRDTSKPKYYVPRHPYQTPSYYPQTPHPILSTPSVFSQLDVETLFYVFYFLPGTYQQYLAAKELKKQSWRFHVKYLTWFQRHSEPQAITEEYEQGVYVYFDWEGSWCQRKKSDFRFEYRYLSED